MAFAFPSLNFGDMSTLPQSAERQWLGAITLICYVPRTRTTRFGRRSFFLAAQVVWNSLPLHLRSPSISRSQFQAGLKTHLFRLVFLRELLKRLNWTELNWLFTTNRWWQRWCSANCMWPVGEFRHWEGTGTLARQHLHQRRPAEANHQETVRRTGTDRRVRGWDHSKELSRSVSCHEFRLRDIRRFESLFLFFLYV